jgi:hypothetical protein
LEAYMLAQIKNHSVRIVIAVAFFLFGFFVVANAVDLGDRDILTGLLAGLVGGATILAAVIRQERGGGSSSPLEC